jgi:hypothetical protein
MSSKVNNWSNVCFLRQCSCYRWRFGAWKLRAPCWCRGMNISIDPGHRARPSRGLTQRIMCECISWLWSAAAVLWERICISHVIMCLRVRGASSLFLLEQERWVFCALRCVSGGLPPSAARRNPQRTLAPGHWPRSKGCGHSSDAWPTAARLIAPALGRCISV